MYLCLEYAWLTNVNQAKHGDCICIWICIFSCIQLWGNFVLVSGIWLLVVSNVECPASLWETRPSWAWHVGPLALERVIICSLICYCQVKLFLRCNVNYQRTDWRVNKCIHVYISSSLNISFTRVLRYTLGSSPLNDMYCVYFSFLTYEALTANLK